MADDEYNKKLESLQQYVPFLEKMIAQLKDPTKPNREQQLAKITSLHSMITEKKKLKLATLNKCEEVVLQLLNKAKAKAQTLPVTPPKSTVTTSEISAVKQEEVTEEKRPASPSYTPKKPIVFSIVSKQKEVLHGTNNKVLVNDPTTNIFVKKPSVFDRLGNRAFYQPRPHNSFDLALTSFKERLKEQGISLSDDEKSITEKTPLRITVTQSFITDGNEEGKKPSESEKKEDMESFDKHEETERPRPRKTSDEKEDFKKISSYDRPKVKDTSEETEDSRKSRSYDRSKYRRSSKERESSLKRNQVCNRTQTIRGSSEELEDSQTSPIRDKFKFKKLSEEKEGLKKRYRHKDRPKYREKSKEREDLKNRSYDKYRARRKFRETSEETDDSRTSPIRDRYKENRKHKERSKHRDSSEESRIYAKHKQRRKFKEESEEKEDLKGSYDKYAEARRIKEERRKRSVYSRYIYKSSKHETDKKSWTETKHKIKIRTENTSDRYDRIRRDYKKYEQKRLDDSDRRKTPTPSDLAKIKLRYQWVNPNSKATVKSMPSTDKVKIEEIPLPTLSTDKSVPSSAMSDVSESSMRDVDMTPVDMVLSPIGGDNEICVENPVTTPLPFPFPSDTLKSESSTETSNSQTIPVIPNSFISDAATTQLPAQSNSCWDYFGSNDQQVALQNSCNEIQQLDYYPESSIPIATAFSNQEPPVLSPQEPIQRRPQHSNREQFRVLREVTEQSPNIFAEEESQKSSPVATTVAETLVKREETEDTPPQPKATESKPTGAQDFTDDEKQMEIINKFLKKLLENEQTRAAASVFIETVSNTLDDEKLKTAVNTVMSPEKQPKVHKARVINRKLILDDDDEAVGSSKEATKKKISKPIIDDDETEEEVTSTVCDDHKPSASKKKKSELDLLHEDLREMFIHDGILTSTGKRMCCLLKDDTDTDSSKASPQPERRTRSLTKKFDMNSLENQEQLKILRSARVVIPVNENLRKKVVTKSHDTDEDEDFHLSRRSRKSRYVEDSEEEDSLKRSYKTSVDENVEKRLKKPSKYENDDSDYEGKQSTKISWSYAEEDSDDEKSFKSKKEEYSLRHPNKVSWSYAEEDSDDTKESKKREEYSLRRSHKFLKCYMEIGSDDEMITKKKVIKVSNEKRKVSPVKSCDDKKVNKVSNEKPKESPTKSRVDQKVKIKVFPTNTETTKKKQEQKAKEENKVVRRKKVSQWALGVIPKLKKKKKEDLEEPKEIKEKKEDSEEPRKIKEKKEDLAKPKIIKENKQLESLLTFVEPDKHYCATLLKSCVVCKLCPFNGRGIAQHYKQAHPQFEVLCSRLQPSQAKKAIEASIKQKLEEFEDDIVLKAYSKYPFQCYFCETKMTSSVTFFYDHVSCHTGEFRHMCSECSFGTSNSKSLRMHYQKVHHKVKDNKPTISYIKKQLYGYLCLECNYVQMNRGSVEDHINIYHSGEGKKIMKINLSSSVISNRRNKPEPSETPEVEKNKYDGNEKEKHQPSENNAEPPLKKRKVEDQADAISLLSLLENFEKNSVGVETLLQNDKPAKSNEETTELVVGKKKNIDESLKVKDKKEANEVSRQKSQSLSLSELLSEKEVNVNRLQKEKSIKKVKEVTAIMKKSQMEKSTNQEKEPIKLSETMKKKWQSLNLEELTIRVLKKGDASESEDVSSDLHTTEDLDKMEPLLGNDELGGSESNSEEEIDVENIETIVEPAAPPVMKMKKIDMSVFTGKTDLKEENDKINQERLKKMMQLNESIKKQRHCLSIVEQLSNRLSQENKLLQEEEMPTLEPAVPVRVHPKETKSSTFTSPRFLQKKTVAPKDNTTIVMSAGFFDVFRQSNELEFVCRVSPCCFTTKYRDTFVTHLNQDHVKINEDYKITECSACQGKIMPNSEKGFLRSFFLHMVDKHLSAKDNESDQIVEKEKTIEPSVSHNDDDNVLSVGLLDIIKGPNSLEYVCRVVFCSFASKNRNAFIAHWNEHHTNFRMTQCRLCGNEIAASAVNNLLSKLFLHLDEKHLGVKSLKLGENPFSFKISEVVSINEDPSPPKEQNFVIESVVSLAEQAEQQKSEDTPVFVIEEVVSLADDLETPGPSNKDQQRLVFESVTSLAEEPLPGSSKQDKPSFSIENVVSVADKPKAWKSESALKVFLQHPKELYKCPQYYCHFVSESRDFFDMHVKSHGLNQNKLVCCVYCDVKTFMGSAGQHIDSYHQNCLYSCSQCLYRALRKEYVKVHMKLKHKQIYSIISLDRPIKNYEAQTKNFPLNETCQPYRCGYVGCIAEFLFQSDYISHLTDSHGGVMVCGYFQKESKCKYTCIKADSMIDHWRTHNCYNFHCLICQVGSMELYTMLEHYSFTHPNRTPYIVDRRRGPVNERHGYNGKAFAKIKYITNEVFSSLSTRHYSMANVNNKFVEVINIEDEEVPATNKISLCDETLLKKFGKTCDPVGRELKCPLCPHFKTNTISYFIYHLFLELKCYRFKCNTCDYSCITYGAIAIHCQDEHKAGKISNITQSPIDKEVQFWIELVINYQAKAITSKFSFEHGEESQSVFRNIQCDVCQRWFRDMDTLHEHELYHWAELVYICRLCRARRQSLNEILQHMVTTHTAQREHAVTRIPSVTKIISTWKSLTSQLTTESVTAFKPLQQNSGESQVLMLPSSAVGQKDAVLYACLLCSKVVKSVEMLQKHNVETHSGRTDNFLCKVLTKSKVEIMLLSFVLP